MRSHANWNRLALVALLSCGLAGGIAHADEPQAGTVPPGWIWQGVWQDGRWSGQWIPGPAPMQAGAYAPAMPSSTDPETQRMINRCRDYRHDSVAGGAVIGGVAGAVVGNRLSGGDRLAGTLVGGAAGAVTGAAIDRAGKKARDRDCEAFFSAHPEFAPGSVAMGAGYPAPAYAPQYATTYAQPYAQAYPQMPYGAGYAPVTWMMVPVVAAPRAAPVETRTVTTEYVDTPRRRVIRARPHRKDKRVYTGS